MSPHASTDTPRVHPGTITFEDADAGTSRQQDVGGVPPFVAWVQVGVEQVAVVRVVSRMRGKQREIMSYGADGALLQTTVQAPR